MNDDDFAELFKKLSSGPSTASWQDVVAEFESLGKTFTEVLRRAWDSTEATTGLGRLREMLVASIEDLNQSVDGTPEAVQARQQLVDLRESLRSAVDRTSAEVRPELLRLLRQANAELRRRTGLEDGTGQ